MKQRTSMALQDDPTAPASPVDRDAATPGKDLAQEHARESVRTSLFGSGSQVKCGRFEIRGQLGAGGMGEVFEGWDPDLERKVALKVLHAAQSDDAAGRKRLVREAQTLARLRHPNVVAVYEVGEDRGRMFVAMELVEGTTLRAWLEARRSQGEIVAVFRQAAAGLQAAHDAGLVHRDFKPDNVMVTDQGEARVVDFGLARAGLSERPPEQLGVEETSLTVTGTLAGTPAYMSPEQLDGRTAGAASDQFSFCVALYTALDGEPPFAGKTFGALRAAVLAGEVRAPGGNIPPRIRAALLRGLQTAASDRHDSMADLSRALEPTPSRTPWLVAGLVAATVAGAGVYASQNDVAPAQPRPGATLCVDTVDLPAQWDAFEPQYEDLLEGVDEYARQQGHRAGRAYASDWQLARAEICEAEEPPARQLECLDAYRERFEAMTRLAPELGNAQLRRALAWGLATNKPKTCTEAEPLFVAHPEGDSQARRDVWDQRVRASAYMIGATQLAGDYEPLRAGLTDPVASVSAEFATFVRDAPVGAAHLWLPETHAWLDSIIERAEAAGAHTTAALAGWSRIRASLGLGFSLDQFRLIGSLDARVRRLDLDLYLGIRAANELMIERDPTKTRRLLDEIEQRLALADFGTIRPVVIVPVIGAWLRLGAPEQANEAVDRMLDGYGADPLPPLMHRGAFAVLPRNIDQLVAQRRHAIARHGLDGTSAPAFLAPEWLELDLASLSRAGAEAIVARAEELEDEVLPSLVALELGDFDSARRLARDLPSEHPIHLSIAMAIDPASGAQWLRDHSTPDGQFTIDVARGLALEATGELERARAVLEAGVWNKTVNQPTDLSTLAQFAFPLARVLMRIDPDRYRPRATALANGALAVYERGGSDLFEPRRAAIRAWLAEQSQAIETGR